MNNRGGSKAEVAVKLALIFFISLFSFSVGTFMGKQVSDSDRRRIALEAEYGQVRSVASHNKEEMKGSITEEDVNELTKEFVEAEKEHVKHNQAQKKDLDHTNATKGHTTQQRAVASTPEKTEDGYVKRPRTHKKDTTKVAHVTTKEDHKSEKAKSFQAAKVPTAVQRVANNLAPTAKHPPKRQLASTLPALSPTSIGKFTVQVASYASEPEAKKHAQALKTDGYSAFYLSAKVKSKTWYRVSVGLFDSRKSANNFKNELIKQSSVSSAIVQKIIR